MQNQHNKLWAVILAMISSEIMILYVYRSLTSGDEKYLICHHVMLISVIYTLYKTATTNPGNPIQNDELMTQRRCKYCEKAKPSRCHHCRKCQKCILRMDHHCAFANNCIGKHNYKYFFCLVLYSILTSIFYFGIYIRKTLDNPSEGMIIGSIIILFALFNVGLVLLLAGYFIFHIKLIIKNKTTVEYFEKRKENYSKSVNENIQEFLGPRFWLLPL